MKLDSKSFLWIGTTLAVFKRVGKVPVVKEMLNKSASCSEISFLSIIKTLLGIIKTLLMPIYILYGPVDLLISRQERINFISSLLIAERKNLSGFSFQR